MVNLEPKEMLDPEETLERMALLEYLVHQDLQDQWEKEDHQDPPGQEDSKECLVPLENLVNLAKMVLQDYLDSLV